MKNVKRIITQTRKFEKEINNLLKNRKVLSKDFNDFKRLAMGKFFDDLKEGFEEILAHRKGKITLKSELVTIPKPPRSYTNADIKQIRESCNYSQALFAKFLNVSIKTIQAWESGQRIPNHAALRLLEIIDKGIYLPEVIQKQRIQTERRKSHNALAA